MIEPEVSFEPPREFNPNNVCFWESTSKELKVARKNGDKPAGVFLTKAKMFLENNCIEQINETSWICKPIPDYNNTTYKIRHPEKGFECNCHGFNNKLRDYTNGDSNVKPVCSHIIAVKQFAFIDSKGAIQL
jgi:hypothetical protein